MAHLRSAVRRWLGSIDPYLIIGVVLSIPALSPLFQPNIPQTADGLLHFYRVVALSDAIQHGQLYPRWLPDLAFGYGQPLFIFYAPLAYYIGLIPYWLGGNAVTTLNISIGAAIVVAMATSYYWGKHHFGPLGGLLVGSAYIYAPYLLFTAYVQGSIPALWAMAFAPLVLIQADRLLDHHRWRDVALLAVATAAMLYTHNISSLIFFPILGGYVLIRILLTDRPSQLIGTVQATIGLGLGLAMSSLFWLPAMVEREFVQIDRVITPPDFDFRAHFLTLLDLLSPVAATNTGLLNPEFPLTLGTIQLVLAAVGGLALVFGRSAAKTSRSAILWGIIVIIVLMIMMTSVATPVWEAIPLLPFIQHPHRLQGVAALWVAALAGGSLAIVPDRWRVYLLSAVLLLLFLSTVSLLYPRYESQSPPATIAGMHRYERAIGAIGTTSFGEYLPRWVTQIPRESPLEEAYQSDVRPPRLDQSYWPEQAHLLEQTADYTGLTFRYRSDQPFSAVINAFYYPSWTAGIDGEPIPIEPFSERGLIQLELPAGERTVRLDFRESSSRFWASMISSLAAIIVLGMFRRTRRPADSRQAAPELSRGELTALVVVAMVMIVLKVVIFDQFDTPLKQQFNGQIAGIDAPLQTNFGHELTLLGYDLPTATVVAGDTLAMTAYWQKHHDNVNDYSILAQLVDSQQNLYASQDNLHPGGLPVSRWQPWGFVRDEHHIEVPAGTPPGDYWLITGPYQPQTWQRLAVVAGAVDGWVDVYAIPVQILRPPTAPAVDELQIQQPLARDLNADIRLLGTSFERDSLPAGDLLRVALFWEAIDERSTDYTITVRLTTRDGDTVYRDSHRPSNDRYPTTLWQAGERVRDNWSIRLPGNLPADEYQLDVAMHVSGANPEVWISLPQTIQITE